MIPDRRASSNAYSAASNDEDAIRTFRSKENPKPGVLDREDQDR
jgi:hypothetical protein